jgi:hypothetical protein
MESPVHRALAAAHQSGKLIVGSGGLAAMMAARVFAPSPDVTKMFDSIANQTARKLGLPGWGDWEGSTASASATPSLDDLFGSGGPDLETARMWLSALPLVDGFGFVPRSIVSPDFNTVSPMLQPMLRPLAEIGALSEGRVFIGVDIQTMLIGDGDKWVVHGRGQVTTVGEDLEIRKWSDGDVVRI